MVEELAIRRERWISLVAEIPADNGGEADKHIKDKNDYNDV